MNIIKYSLFVVALASTAAANAQQTDRDCIRQGNRYFRAGEMDKAVTFYQKAIEKNPTVEAFYNLGCASQDSTTLESYMKAESLGFRNAGKRAMNFHNMGNIWFMTCMAQIRSNDPNLEKYIDAAIENYKSALRCNPSDNETRYNLAVAQWFKKNSHFGDGKQQQEQQKKEQKKDEMSDEVVEQLLRSAQQDEKDVQKKVNVQQNRRRSLEKDW
ncbi:MAG: tetratricopeptide repeat protein [Bacteroidaceae bacterium]|nr:tetratricopeptide repeat protein [Bacteroidaceae bacterium]